jgi:peroxiredoxin
MKIRTYALVFGVALAAASLVFAQEGVKAEIGKASPEWKLTDTKGKEHSLADFKGKYVVLEWVNKDCPFVKKHYGSGNMQATQKKAKEMGAVWLSICSSAPGKQGYMPADEADAYMKSAGFNSAAYLLDSSGVVGKIYNAKTTPQIVIIDPKGTVLYNGAIDDKPSANPESLKDAKNYALAALTEAMAGKQVSVSTSQPYGCSVKY